MAVNEHNREWSAITAEQQSEMDDAIVMLQEATDQQHVLAADVLAATYYYGRGCARDFAKAFACYKVAAEGGDLSCMVQVAYLLKIGRGVARDERQGLKWLLEAEKRGSELMDRAAASAEHGGHLNAHTAQHEYSQCLNHLSEAHFNGHGGLTPSVRLALEYLERALELCPAYYPEKRSEMMGELENLRHFREHNTGGLMGRRVVVALDESHKGKRGVVTDFHSADFPSDARCSVQLDTGELINLHAFKLRVEGQGGATGKGKGKGKKGRGKR